MNADTFGADDPVRVFLAANRSRAAGRRTRRLLAKDELQIRQHAPRRIDDVTLFSSDMERSLGRLTHGFLAVADWVGVRERLSPRDRRLLMRKAISLVESWRELADPETSMAFHDETTAQRTMNLVALRHDYRDVLDESQDAVLREVIDRDIALLGAADFYAGTNNHGMFQDIALLVAAALYDQATDPEGLRDLAVQRLVAYFSVCFTADGIHVENNPTYHVMVSRYLSRVIAYASTCGREADFGDLADVLDHAEEYAAHAVTPQGSFPPVSDTAVMALAETTARSAYPGERFLGAVSLGRRGTPPEQTCYVVEGSGYAIHRSAWSVPSASFTFFSAAYNADYHKHSDELSLYILDDGRELLREAGPFGYDHANPYTGYGFSSAAHNTMLVDGRGLPRTDRRPERTTLEDLGSGRDSMHVRGRTRRYEGVEWTRELEVSADGAKAPIHIRDRVTSQDRHEYTFLWHVGPELDVLARGNALEMFTEAGQKVGELTWSGSATSRVRTIRGQDEPTVQGWAFPVMGTAVPASVLEVTVPAETAEIDWELRTADFRLADRGITPGAPEWSSFQGEKSVNYLLDVPEGGADRLDVVFTAIHQPWDFTYNYRASLAGTGAATLFVLDDFGDQGAYYLANNRGDAEFRSVQALLKRVLDELGIGLEAVTAIGSSKGGSAALLHGISLGVAQVIAGAPQTRLGTFLARPHPNILEYIAGGTSEEDITWADSALERVLAAGDRSTSIQMVVGRKDHHYSGHVLPFADSARDHGYSVQVLSLPGTPHARIGAAFRSYLESWVAARNGDDAERRLAHVAVHDPDTDEIGAAVDLPEGWQASFTLYRGRDAVQSVPYGDQVCASWPVTESGEYRVRVHARPPHGGTISFGTRAFPVARPESTGG